MNLALRAPFPGTSGRVRLAISVRGAVQGVGFRPFIHRQASGLDLAGWVANTAEGVSIEAEGDPARLERLLDAIRASPPPNARIAELQVARIDVRGDAGFTIRPSLLDGARTSQVLADLATCETCLAELLDPSDRRFRYPFINCTDCGPRFSIIEGAPYDRSRTSMRGFAMCAACQAEYDDPSSRRFHAEPNACPDCGPRLSLLDSTGRSLAGDEAALALATAALRRGEIVAVKGVGGFHLLVDAASEAAVLRLRARKRRPDKPFAVMFRGLEGVLQACSVSAQEQALLTGPERPVVLLRRRGGAVAEAVAPGNPWLGAILPYSPLHHLLLNGLDDPVVATSGNLSGEPIAIDAHEALERLSGVADLVLSHDRPIVRPAEDSVARVVCGRPLLLRRARGYAPAPFAVGAAAKGVLALGGHLKTTLALGLGDGVAVWPHIGDLETVEARLRHAAAAEDMAQLYAVRPRLVVRELHPDYASNRTAEIFAAPVVAVQHHLAHVAACMADNGAAPPVLGVAWDGAGYGPDGTVWGGEFLTVGEDGWRRVARLRPFRLPGGERAAREPRRAALGLLHAAFGEAALAMDDLAPVAAFSPAERRTLGAMLAQGVNAPLCSSIGRLFDAASALAGLRQRSTYEGQAAAEMEWAAGDSAGAPGYDFPVRSVIDGIVDLELDWGPALCDLIADVRSGAAPGKVSEALHAGLAAGVVEVARRVAEPRVALTGGCFQNARLTEATVTALRRAGFEALWHRRTPPNDGGLALGQAAWAAQMERMERRPCA